MQPLNIAVSEITKRKNSVTSIGPANKLCQLPEASSTNPKQKVINVMVKKALKGQRSSLSTSTVDPESTAVGDISFSVTTPLDGTYVLISDVLSHLNNP